MGLTGLRFTGGRSDAPDDSFSPASGNLPDAYKMSDSAPFDTTYDGFVAVFARMGFSVEEVSLECIC